MPSPLLAIKIGNSNVTVGVFENSTLVARWRVHTETDRTADEYAILLNDLFAQTAFVPPLELSSSAGPLWRGVVIVSVVPALTTTILELCHHYLERDPLVVNENINTGMPIRYDNPHSLGTDRIVGAVAAKAKFGSPVIVIDFGTATTFNAVNRVGEFVGGAIAPGLNLAADSLYRATAQLPRIDLALPPGAIATNTVHGMQSGILLGYLGLVEGMVARMRLELDAPDAYVVATGGLAWMLAPLTRVIEAVEPDLILNGLRLIFEMKGGRP